MKGTNEQKAEQNYTPRPPRVHELGGGIYYKCYWINCDEDINKWYNFCPKCGQRIYWEGGEYED